MSCEKQYKMKEALKNWITMWGIVIGALALVVIPLIIFDSYWRLSGLVLILILVFIGSYFLMEEEI